MSSLAQAIVLIVAALSITVTYGLYRLLDVDLSNYWDKEEE